MYCKLRMIIAKFVIVLELLIQGFILVFYTIKIICKWREFLQGI